MKLFLKVKTADPGAKNVAEANSSFAHRPSAQLCVDGVDGCEGLDRSFAWLCLDRMDGCEGLDEKVVSSLWRRLPETLQQPSAHHRQHLAVCTGPDHYHFCQPWQPEESARRLLEEETGTEAGSSNTPRTFAPQFAQSKDGC